MSSIVHLSAELAPYAKAGGLADAVAGLCQALSKAGWPTAVYCPFYPHFEKVPKEEVDAFSLKLPGCTQPIRLFRLNHASAATVYILKCGDYFDRSGLYGQAGKPYSDNLFRYGLFTHAALNCLIRQGLPSLLHLHDWTTATAPLFLRTHLQKCPPTILSVHNFYHQGHCQAETLESLHLPPTATSFLEAGLQTATLLHTVSAHYAREALEASQAGDLRGLLKSREKDLVGILNGIDTQVWNPASDPFLPATFSLHSLGGKTQCKLAFQKEIGLESSARAPLFVAVARLRNQKGIDLLLDAFSQLFSRPTPDNSRPNTDKAQLFILGEGDRQLSRQLSSLAAQHPQRCAFHQAWCEGKAHRAIAASDFFLMPSRFEPCGLTQMYAMRYGSIPIVHLTGGLADTVSKDKGWGLPQATTAALQKAIEEAIDLHTHHPTSLARLQKNGLRSDFSWQKRMPAYTQLYQLALARHRPTPP